MASRTLPNIQLKAFWDLGEDNWKDENDLNLLRLSVLVQAGAVDLVAALPGSPTDGQVYVLDETAGGNANHIAVRDAGAWKYFQPSEGWLIYNRTANEYLSFDGTEWLPLGLNLPAYDPVDDAGKVLTIKLDGTGFEWTESAGGGGGGETTVVTAARWRIIADGPGSDGENVGFGEIQWIDPFGDQIFESGVVDSSSYLPGFPEINAVDGITTAGNGWMADTYAEGGAAGVWWEQNWVAARTVAGVMLYPISGDLGSAPESFRAQYFNGSSWLDAGTFTAEWTTDSQQYFAFNASVPSIDEDAVWDMLKAVLNAGTGVTFDIDEEYRVITVNASGGGGATTPHTIGFGYGPPAEASEVVFSYVFVENVQWADEIVGSFGHQGIVTTATYNLTIQKNGADIGVIQFQNTPSVSFGITGSSPIDWAPGDVLTVVGAATPDATLGEVAVTFYGTRLPES